MQIKIKRVYENASEDDGYRLLVDRVWPRGVSKEDAELDEWNKQIAPTEKLRKWFDHDPNKFTEFAEKYREEIKGKKEALKEIKKTAKSKTVTLLYGAKDTENNQAVVLKKILEE